MIGREGRLARRLFGALSICCALALGAVSLWLLAGCGGSSTSDAQERETRLVAQGREVFATHCASCHAIEGRPRGGSTGEYGTSFDLVKPKESLIARRIEVGAYGMQTFREDLTAPEKVAVTQYLLATAGRAVPTRPVASAADIAAGERAFGRYCQSCHTIGDHRRTNTRVVFPGTNFNNVAVSAERVQDMVDRGNWWMPALYERVPRPIVHDIIAYVVSASGRGRAAFEDY